MCTSFRNQSVQSSRKYFKLLTTALKLSISNNMISESAVLKKSLLRLASKRKMQKSLKLRRILRLMFLSFKIK
jgi:hypothetical protein